MSGPAAPRGRSSPLSPPHCHSSCRLSCRSAVREAGGRSARDPVPARPAGQWGLVSAGGGGPPWGKGSLGLLSRPSQKGRGTAGLGLGRLCWAGRTPEASHGDFSLWRTPHTSPALWFWRPKEGVSKHCLGEVTAVPARGPSDRLFCGFLLSGGGVHCMSRGHRTGGCQMLLCSGSR